MRILSAANVSGTYTNMCQDYDTASSSIRRRPLLNIDFHSDPHLHPLATLTAIEALYEYERTTFRTICIDGGLTDHECSTDVTHSAEPSSIGSLRTGS